MPGRVVGVLSVAVFAVVAFLVGLLLFRPPPPPPDDDLLPYAKRGLAASTVTTRAAPVAATTRAAPPPPPTLLQARSNFQSRLLPAKPRQPMPPDRPPPAVFQLVRYPAPPGKLAAYVTPDPGDGRRRPAVVWCHGGFYGIAGYLWDFRPAENDQSARAFLTHDFVVMCPSWRGENDNPGRFELFLGEVDDLLAALEYLKKLDYVDPERIYLAGHSTGGTMALLGAEASRDVRAAFSFGGAPDVGAVVSDGKGYGNTPYDHRSEAESRVRSATHFAHGLNCPTFYFEGADSGYNEDARVMEASATKFGRLFQAFAVEGGNHFNILAPLTRMVADRIKYDTGPECGIRFTEADVRSAFRRKH